MRFTRLFIWAMIMAMPVWFASCKKDGSEAITPSGSSVEGSWKISGMKVSVGSDSEDLLEYIKTVLGAEGAKAVACLTESKITFNGNGKITGTASPNCQSDDAADFNPAVEGSTWKVTGDKLTITDSDGPETYDLTVSGNKMTWSVQEEQVDDDGVKQKYTTTIEFKRA